MGFTIEEKQEILTLAHHDVEKSPTVVTEENLHTIFRRITKNMGRPQPYATSWFMKGLQRIEEAKKGKIGLTEDFKEVVEEAREEIAKEKAEKLTDVVGLIKWEGQKTREHFTEEVGAMSDLLAEFIDNFKKDHLTRIGHASGPTAAPCISPVASKIKKKKLLLVGTGPVLVADIKKTEVFMGLTVEDLFDVKGVSTDEIRKVQAASANSDHILMFTRFCSHKIPDIAPEEKLVKHTGGLSSVGISIHKILLKEMAIKL